MHVGKLQANFGDTHLAGRDLVAHGAAELFESRGFPALVRGTVGGGHLRDEIHGGEQREAAFKVRAELLALFVEGGLAVRCGGVAGSAAVVIENVLRDFLFAAVFGHHLRDCRRDFLRRGFRPSGSPCLPDENDTGDEDGDGEDGGNSFHGKMRTSLSVSNCQRTGTLYDELEVGMKSGLNRAGWSQRGARFLVAAVALLGAGAYGVRWMHGPRIVAWEALAPDNAEECTDPPSPVAEQLPNWSGDIPLRQAFLQADSSAATNAAPASNEAADILARKPLRIIRDPNSAYSAVAVDTSHNEVVLTDENLFNVLVYDRETNTRPTSVSDPRRIIGGLNTKIEFQCGLYIDPANGDIYAVNNDTVDSLVIFSRQAVGNVAPDRELHTPHGTFGIAVDEESKEMFLSVQHDNALVVYNKMAKGAEAPLRVVQGSHTGLADPHGMVLDPKNKTLFVANHGSYHEVAPPAPGEKRRGTVYPGFPLAREDAIPGSGKLLPPSISVYSRDAKGDAAPLRVIQGPKTQMDWPTALSLDLDRNELFVANDGGNSILVFDANASGDVAPLRVIKGPKSLVSNPTGVYFDAKNQELWAANFGNHTSAVYNPKASGDAAPLRVIRSAKATDPTPGMGNPHPIAYDTKRQQLLVPN